MTDTIDIMTRRTFVPSLAVAGAFAVAADDERPIQRKGRLKQCVTNGVFGRGRPLDFSEYFSAPVADRLGFSLLKSAGVLPPELELLKEVETLEKALAKCRDERTRARTRHQIQTKRTMFAMALERRGKSARADRSLAPPHRVR